jgi:C1A family cysteine protease
MLMLSVFLLCLSHSNSHVFASQTESLATGATLANSETLPMDPMGACSVYQSSGKALPETVDWVAGGLVLPPKDQGTCGSCWTYGTTGAIEGQWAKKTGKLVSLSQQNMMDCTWAYSNNACGGGSDYLAYAWILQQNSGSIADAESYGQYLNQDGFCHYAVNDKTAGTTNPFTHEPVQQGAKITGCQHVTPFWNATDSSVPPPADQANALLNDALANTGPVSVAIDATMEDFYFYHKGYFYNSGCGADLNSLDHIVLATGYTTVGGQKYTRIRNSWSTHWGDGGYAWISQKDNCCGVGTQPSIVTV